MTIGQSVPRVEDLRLTTGKGRYTSDFSYPNVAHAHFLRAEHAHAFVRSINVAEAREAPGVLAAFTATEYEADGRHPIPHNAVPPDAVDVSRPGFVTGPTSRVFEADQPPLSTDRVRYLGEVVAMVVAETADQARDAAELIIVDYQLLPVVVSTADALAEVAPRLWPELEDNVGLSAEYGDEEATRQAFDDAHLVLEREFLNQRIVACQMEPRSAIGLHDTERDEYTVVAGSQGVVRWRMALARALGREPSQVRVVCPDVGGGFGPRTSISPEAVLVTWAASQVGRPVRWVGDRTECFLSDYQGRDISVRTALALDRDGRILAVRQSQICNNGAYPVSYAPLVNSHRIVSTVYRVPVGRVSVRGVFTNTIPTVPYRGAGRPEVTFAMERILDMAAPRLGLDRVEIRRRNLVSRDQLPYRTFMGLTLDSGAFESNMDRALDLADWHGFAGRRAESAARGMLRGIGVGNYVETPVGAPRERLEMALTGDGVELVVGTQSTGQGHETTYAQVVRSLLGVPVEKVRLLSGDTARVSVGGGTHSDRSMRLVGTLLDDGCRQIADQARERAAHLFGCNPAEVRLADGILSGPATNRTLDLFELAAQEPLSAMAEVSKRLPAFPTGCAVCELEIDPDTGVATILRYSSVDDVGQPINPLIVDGQVHGGIAQGVGQALLEVFRVDPESGQALSASFMDYAMPKADTLPNFDVELAEDPTSLNPLRVKGGGEGGITPAIAAVIGAVSDALSVHGIEHVEMPATPVRIWEALRNSRTATAEA